MDSVASWSYFELMLWMSKHQRIGIEIVSWIFLFKTHLFILPRTSRNTYWIGDPFMQVKPAKHMVKSKTKSISSLGAFSNFLKLHVQFIFFSKFLHEIEAAAVCFVMEHGRRKSQQNSRICVHAQVKLVYPVRNLSDSSKSLDDRQIK